MYYYVHIGDEGPQGPPTRRTEIKSTKPKPSAQWAVLVSLVAHQTIEALTGIICRCDSRWGGGAKSYCNCNPHFEGSAYILGVLVTIWP